MRLEVTGVAGELAGHPEEALTALANAAAADGADVDDWLEKAMANAGAMARSIPVSRDPAFKVVDGVTERAMEAYATAMKLCREAVRERLEQAAREADTSAYAKLAKERT